MPGGHLDMLGITALAVVRAIQMWKAPRVRGFVATGYPVRRHHRAASFNEWHYTTPDLRRLQFAAAALTGDTRTFARYLARCTSWYRIRSAAQLWLQFYACTCHASKDFSLLFFSGNRHYPVTPEKQTLSDLISGKTQAAAAASAFSKLMPPFFTSTRITSFGPNRPSRMCLASGFSICDWMARFNGRAP